jgi:hypothetical protein
MDVDGRSVDHCSAQRPTAVHWSNFLASVNWDRSMGDDKPKLIVISAPNRSVGGIAQPRGILRDHIQHRLQVSRRVSDHAEDLTCRHLLIQRFVNFSLIRLKLLGDAL